jgi:predicted nucleotidyltransferase
MVTETETEGSKKLNVIFASYREWANDVGVLVHDHPRVNGFSWAESQADLERQLSRPPFEIDIVMLCGWSWPPEQWMVNSVPLMLSEHPAASDRYTPGTPLQNQIIDGLLTTKHRIVRVGFPELAPRQWSHEVDMSLEGHMDEVLERMRVTSIELFGAFLRDYPRISWKEWPVVERQAPRRTPADSKLHGMLRQDDFDDVPRVYTAHELYNTIRCLEAPYPNAYVEDETGRLYFERVRFEPK